MSHNGVNEENTAVSWQRAYPYIFAASHQFGVLDEGTAAAILEEAKLGRVGPADLAYFSSFVAENPHAWTRVGLNTLEDGLRFQRLLAPSETIFRGNHNSGLVEGGDRYPSYFAVDGSLPNNSLSEYLLSKVGGLSGQAYGDSVRRFLKRTKIKNEGAVEGYLWGAEIPATYNEAVALADEFNLDRFEILSRWLSDSYRRDAGSSYLVRSPMSQPRETSRLDRLVYFAAAKLGIVDDFRNVLPTAITIPSFVELMVNAGFDEEIIVKTVADYLLTNSHLNVDWLLNGTKMLIDDNPRFAEIFFKIHSASFALRRSYETAAALETTFAHFYYQYENWLTDKVAVAEIRLSFYERALNYYQLAADRRRAGGGPLGGGVNSNAITEVSKKIQQLREVIRRLSSGQSVDNHGEGAENNIMQGGVSFSDIPPEYRLFSSYPHTVLVKGKGFLHRNDGIAPDVYFDGNGYSRHKFSGFTESSPQGNVSGAQTSAQTPSGNSGAVSGKPDDDNSGSGAYSLEAIGTLPTDAIDTIIKR